MKIPVIPSRLAGAFDSRLILVSMCFLLSGFAALIYQTAWTQRFGLVFGTSELAVAAVLAAYMAGLATGAALAGRYLVNTNRPVLVYALLELGIALGALAVPSGLSLASDLQVLLLGGTELSTQAMSLGSALFYLAVTFVVLFIPTALMGASLPVLARYAVQRDEQIGSRIGLLYTVNTTGAALGTLGAAFGLLPELGLAHTILVAVAVNFLVFLLAAWLALVSGTGGRLVVESLPTAPAKGGLHWVLVLMMASGFIAFVYEVLWTRLLSNILGGTLYAFATMLATFLCGIALGAAVAAPLARDPYRARVGLVAAQLGIALCSLAAFAAADYLAGFASAMRQGGASFSQAGFLAAATLLPAALFMGAAFPFAVRVLAENAAQAGRASARVFAWNTAGAILGAVAAGFFILPWLHFAGTVTLTAAAGIGLAAFAALYPRPRRAVFLAPLVAALAVILIWPPATPSKLLRTSPLSGRAMHGELAYLGVGRSATVLLMKQGAYWRLVTNGLPESAVAPKGARMGNVGVAHWLGALPVVSRPDGSSMMVIGFGAGRTLEAIAPSFSDIHVVELEPEVLRANRLVAAHREFNPFTDPRIKIHLNDARGALQLARRRFDAIVSQPSHPWTGGASNLFTRDFFQLVRERLTTDGVYVQWIGLPFVDEEQFRALLAALNEVFSHVEVYMPPPGGGLLFLASMHEPLSRDSIAKGLNQGWREWRRMGVLVPEDIYAARVLDSSGSRLLAADSEANSDNRNLLRLRPPGEGVMPLNNRTFMRLVGDADPMLAWGAPDGDLLGLRRLLERGQIPRARRLADGISDPSMKDTALGLVDLAARRPQRGRQALWRALSTDPGNSEAFHGLLLSYRRDFVNGNPPNELISGLQYDKRASAVVEGWRLSSRRRSRDIRELEAQLAEIGPAHPLYANAIRLRVAWRLAVANPNTSLEGLAMLEPLLAFRANPQMLLIRARLAFAANNTEVALASLDEISRRLPLPDKREPLHTAIASAARKLLTAFAVDSAHAAEIARLNAALTKGWSAARDGTGDDHVTDDPGAGEAPGGYDKTRTDTL